MPLNGLLKKLYTPIASAGVTALLLTTATIASCRPIPSKVSSKPEEKRIVQVYTQIPTITTNPSSTSVLSTLPYTTHEDSILGPIDPDLLIKCTTDEDCPCAEQRSFYVNGSRITEQRHWYCVRNIEDPRYGTCRDSMPYVIAWED